MSTGIPLGFKIKGRAEFVKENNLEIPCALILPLPNLDGFNAVFKPPPGTKGKTAAQVVTEECKKRGVPTNKQLTLEEMAKYIGSKIVDVPTVEALRTSIITGCTDMAARMMQNMFMSAQEHQKAQQVGGGGQGEPVPADSGASDHGAGDNDESDSDDKLDADMVASRQQVVKLREQLKKVQTEKLQLLSRPTYDPKKFEVVEKARDDHHWQLIRDF
jgi:hypothetical protein